MNEDEGHGHNASDNSDNDVKERTIFYNILLCMLNIFPCNYVQSVNQLSPLSCGAAIVTAVDGRKASVN
jgi:hypothetical protein